MEAIGIGDLHLQDNKGKGGLSNLVEDHNTFVMREVQHVLDYAVSKSVTNIFLYGDSFESPRGSYEGQLGLIALFRRNPDLDFTVILGNHDMLGVEASVGHSLELVISHKLRNVKVITKPTVLTIDGSKVNFLPWPHSDFNKKMLNVAHVEVKGSKLDSGRTFDSDGLSSSTALVVCGHLHTNHRVRNTYYSGTLYQTNFGEQPKKYFHHIHYNSVHDYEIVSIPHKPFYILHNLIVSSKDDFADLDTSPNNIYKIIIQDGADVSVDDYKMLNVASVKAWRSKQELEQILIEDAPAAELVIRTSDFFQEWLASNAMSKKLKRQVNDLRIRLLGAK